MSKCETCEKGKWERLPIGEAGPAAYIMCERHGYVWPPITQGDWARDKEMVCLDYADKRTELQGLRAMHAPTLPGLFEAVKGET